MIFDCNTAILIREKVMIIEPAEFVRIYQALLSLSFPEQNTLLLKLPALFQLAPILPRDCDFSELI